MWQRSMGAAFVAPALLVMAFFSPAPGAEEAGCASETVRAQLLRLAIKRMKGDQMMNDMADLDSAGLSLSHVETVQRPDASVSCKAIVTMRVRYAAGLVRTIDNNATYDLLRRGEDQHLAVKINTFATAF